MKKNIITFFVVMSAAVNLFAQQQSDVSAADSRISKLRDELSLNEEQVARLKEINEKFRSEQIRLRGASTNRGQKAYAERQRILEERNSQIKGVLTEEQFAKWIALSDGRLEAQRERRPVNRIEDMKSVVGLTDEQSKKIMVINSEMSKAFRNLRSDSTRNAKTSGEKIKKIKKERDAKIKKILTEEQYPKFLAYEAEMPGKGRRAEGRPRHK